MIKVPRSGDHTLWCCTVRFEWKYLFGNLWEQIVTRDKSLFTRTTLVTGSSETFCSVKGHMNNFTTCILEYLGRICLTRKSLVPPQIWIEYTCPPINHRSASPRPWRYSIFRRIRKICPESVLLPSPLSSSLTAEAGPLGCSNTLGQENKP